ncbi:DUF481 domain-containing protein [Pelagicoccus albus]|uniref:DUF481 domain-containing protein n=1 Tax=Pelagicoccus albus TaxID=415222 RepID=A0A7X1E8T9_9BACT|nr:DUF481 domain-containing protein [Pelagicoccus albus]MBC2606483.1 DUF481 domain-containing protein [Pelagicoccus albus]
MKLTKAISLTALAFLVSAASADVIYTVGGSTINGKVLGIDGGKITISTDFAGKIQIEQDKVASMSTDDPLYLSLEDGSTYLGPVTGSEEGLVVDSEAGEMNTTVAKISESWQPGEKSPSALRQEAKYSNFERKWAYEAAFDLTGKSGNSDSNGMAASFRATLDGEADTLAFYAKANFEDADGVKSADDANGGVDYSNKFTENYNWYVRSEFGYDAIKEIEQYFTVAAGFGRILSDTETRKMSLRGGLGYIFESYDDLPVLNDAGEITGYTPRSSTSSASLDLGFTHKETLKWGTWVNRTTFTPTIDDFSNFRAVHDTSLDLPLKAEGWSLRTGVNFKYDSEADVSNLEELDTTYYIRMVLKWL